jgi:hypothetical protein
MAHYFYGYWKIYLMCYVCTYKKKSVLFETKGHQLRHDCSLMIAITQQTRTPRVLPCEQYSCHLGIIKSQGYKNFFWILSQI